MGLNSSEMRILFSLKLILLVILGFSYSVEFFQGAAELSGNLNDRVKKKIRVLCRVTC